MTTDRLFRCWILNYEIVKTTQCICVAEEKQPTLKKTTQTQSRIVTISIFHNQNCNLLYHWTKRRTCKSKRKSPGSFQGPVSRKPRKLFGSEKAWQKSQTLSLQSCPFHTIFIWIEIPIIQIFTSVHYFVIKIRVIKDCFPGPKSYRDFWETGPTEISLALEKNKYVLEQGFLAFKLSNIFSMRHRDWSNPFPFYDELLQVFIRRMYYNNRIENRGTSRHIVYFNYKKRWHSASPGRVVLGLPSPTPRVCTDGRTDVRWRQNQNFSDQWVTKFAYPWCSASSAIKQDHRWQIAGRHEYTVVSGCQALLQPLSRPQDELRESDHEKKSMVSHS